MELTRLLVYLLAGLSVHASSVHEDADGITEAVTEDQRKVHQECRNLDYKKYLKCLMRPKRHHHTHGNEPSDIDSSHCLETCLKKCDLEHDCEKKCGHCMKRTKHKHQIITEYEASCESGNCNGDDGLRTTNITTNIDINNIIQLHNRTTTSGKTGTGDCKGNGGNGGNGRNGGNGGNGEHGGNGENGENGGNGKDGGGRRNGDGRKPDHCCPQYLPDCRPCYSSQQSMSLIPQISLVPQITYGVGLGAIGGCAYNQWPCIQQQTSIHRVEFPNQPDCSGCGNPFLRYRCDISCYMTQGTTTNIGTPCKGSACMTGST